VASVIYETLTLSLRPATLLRLEPVIRGVAEAEWEDDAVQTELMNLANDFASRLQRIERGDVQKA
jgi:hypothetical protein